MAVSTNTFIKDSTLLIRSFVASGVTDPISASRNAASKFVLTANPTRNIEWPHVVIKQENISSRRLGLASEQQLVTIPFSTRIWARNQTEKDDLTQQTLNALRTRQYGSAEANENKLFGFEVTSATDIDELEQNGPKSKILRFQYFVILTE